MTNMDVYHQVKHRLQGPLKVKKFFSHWFIMGYSVVRTDGGTVT